MEYRIVILTFVSIFVYSSAILTEKPDVIEVTEENKDEFALPVGTKLKLDEKTKLYKPPPVSASFSENDRMEIQWYNKNVRDNFCKVDPGDASFNWEWLKTKFHIWCHDKDGEDICCGKRKCSCNPVLPSCNCVSQKEFDYYEQQKDKDIDKYLGTANKAADWYFKTTAKPADGEEPAVKEPKKIEAPE